MGVRIYAAIRPEALKRFLAALRWCFRFGCCVCGVAFCFGMLCNRSISFSVAICWCRWYSYRLIFFVACRRFILSLNGIPIFYHFIPFLLPFFTILRFFGARSAEKVGFFFGLLHKGGVCLCETVAGFGGVCRVRTVAD